ncbi:MAG: endopeptidase La [Christensenellales bacterium]|jgi:ATP-dependent Lon protease
MAKLLRIIKTDTIIYPYSSGVIEFFGKDVKAELDDISLLSDQVIFLPYFDRVFLQTDGAADFVGVLASIDQIVNPESGNIRLLYTSYGKVSLKNFTTIDKSVYSEYENIKYENEDSRKSAILATEFLSAYYKYCLLNQLKPLELKTNNINTNIDIVIKSLSTKDEQAIFTERDTEKRLVMAVKAIQENIEIIELEKRVSEEVKRALEDNQKEFYIRTQMAALSKELGEGDEVEDYIEKVSKLKAGAEVKEKLLQEVSKIRRTAPQSPEMAILKNYLDLAISLPWGKYTVDNTDLKRAEEILNQDHYGIEKVKQRLIEALAVRKLSKKGRSPIICLVGPPGIGKTSIAQSIARAMGKKYVRLSFGGVRDEAEIRGHRKTYVGAMPGRIITGIVSAGSMNPVFLMDEIDKMASDYKGDPASALLEVLDPEQNSNFRDHYLELSFDLSKVLFITTANTLDTISRPLLDRMEVIEMSGYTLDEKVEIARRYLVDKAIAQNGIKKDLVSISEGAIEDIIEKYTRESGVRELEKKINAIMRKAARSYVANKDMSPIKVTSRNLHNHLGKPLYENIKKVEEDKVGVVNGLAYTPVGGDTLSIEVALIPFGEGKIIMTGSLGDVMKESAEIALNYIKTVKDEYNIEDEKLKSYNIHIHVPSGATPKDGPSAGITIASAILSQLTGREVFCNIAMTGEITLTGRVLPIGGLKEKALAGLRAGVDTIILPYDNQNDVEELPAKVKNSIKFNFVKDAKEVFKQAINFNAGA